MTAGGARSAAEVVAALLQPGSSRRSDRHRRLGRRNPGDPCATAVDPHRPALVQQSVAGPVGGRGSGAVDRRRPGDGPLRVVSRVHRPLPGHIHPIRRARRVGVPVVAALAAFLQSAVHDVHHSGGLADPRRPSTPLPECGKQTRHRVAAAARARTCRPSRQRRCRHRLDRERRFRRTAEAVGNSRVFGTRSDLPGGGISASICCGWSTAWCSWSCCSAPISGNDWCRRRGTCSPTRCRPPCSTCRCSYPRTRDSAPTTHCSCSPTSSRCSSPRRWRS